MNFCQKSAHFYEFIEISANFCQFFDVFRRIFLAHIAQATQAYIATPIYDSLTRIRPRSQKKKPKKPQFSPILKISILNHVNLGKPFPPFYHSLGVFVIDGI
jgi:hypothetical protein